MKFMFLLYVTIFIRQYLKTVIIYGFSNLNQVMAVLDIIMRMRQEMEEELVSNIPPFG